MIFMKKIMKCDRCGRESEIKDTEDQYWGEIFCFRTLENIPNTYGELKDAFNDICPQCVSQFSRWWDRKVDGE